MGTRGPGRPRTRGIDNLPTPLKALGTDQIVDHHLTKEVPEGKKQAKWRTRPRRPDESPLNYRISLLPGGRFRAVELLRSMENDNAKAFLAEWDKLSRTLQKSCNLERIAEVAGLTPGEVFGLIGEASFNEDADTAQVISSMAYPMLMSKSVQRAMEPDATAEREMHFKAKGYVPTSKGIQIGIKNVNQLREQAEPGEATPFDGLARRVVRELPK